MVIGTNSTFPSEWKTLGTLLEDINLSYIRLYNIKGDNDSSIATLIKYIPNTVETLTLSTIGIGDECVNELVQKSLPSLKRLFITSNNVTSAAPLANAAPTRFPSLKRLVMSYNTNMFTDGDLQALAEAVSLHNLEYLCVPNSNETLATACKQHNVTLEISPPP